MRPKEIVTKWVEAFTNTDVETLANLYAESTINHQVINSPVEGRAVGK